MTGPRSFVHYYDIQYIWETFHPVGVFTHLHTCHSVSVIIKHLNPARSLIDVPNIVRCSRDALLPPWNTNSLTFPESMANHHCRLLLSFNSLITFLWFSFFAFSISLAGLLSSTKYDKIIKVSEACICFFCNFFHRVLNSFVIIFPLPLGFK